MKPEPENKYRHQPEIVVCVETAKNDVRPSIYNKIEIPTGMKANGNLTAIKANKYIRAQLPVLKKKDFHGARPTLNDFLAENNMRCCVCVNETFVYQTKAGKAHGFNRGMIGRTLELLWEKFQNNSFLYIFMCL